MLNHFELGNKHVALKRIVGHNVLGVLALLFAMCFTSCVPVESMIYLQPDGDIPTEVFRYDKQEYKLQMNDILDVKISSLNPEVNALFNASTAGTMQVAQATAQTGGDLFYITGYSIDQDGNIDIPFVGMVGVLGLTLNEAHEQWMKGVRTLHQLPPSSQVGGCALFCAWRIQSTRKTRGDAEPSDHLRSHCVGGDLSLVANRKEIRLIRQHPEGTKIHNINLLDESVVESPYYFIQPNDVLYAEPLPQRSWGIGVTGAQTLNTSAR